LFRDSDGVYGELKPDDGNPMKQQQTLQTILPILKPRFYKKNTSQKSTSVKQQQSVWYFIWDKTALSSAEIWNLNTSSSIVSRPLLGQCRLILGIGQRFYLLKNIQMGSGTPSHLFIKYQNSLGKTWPLTYT
jgi:hypothetical protein